MCSMRGSPVEMLSYPAMHGDGVPGILVYAMRRENFELASVLLLARIALEAARNMIKPPLKLVQCREIKTCSKYAQIVNKYV